MTSLVAADYGSSSEDEIYDDKCNRKSSDNESVTKEEEEPDIDFDSDFEADSDDERNQHTNPISSIPQEKVSLPSASALLASTTPGLVFNNPFKLEENAKIASLEKHVKMVATTEHTKAINGKKICWNFRKGRCRFGSNCTFAHDSDLHIPSNVNLKEAPNALIQVIDTGAAANSLKSKKLQSKKRPGLTSTLIPNKKVMSHYHSTK